MRAKINAHQKALETLLELAKLQLDREKRNTIQMARIIESQDALWDTLERISKHLEKVQEHHQQIQERFELIEYRYQAYLDSKKGKK